MGLLQDVAGGREESGLVIWGPWPPVAVLHARVVHRARPVAEPPAPPEAAGRAPPTPQGKGVRVGETARYREPVKENE